MLLIFRLGRPDVLPTADLGVRKGFARIFGLAELPTVTELTDGAEPWRPYRSAASWYLWRATELTEEQIAAIRMSDQV
jgi:DNA-3-methyladenine glycosylase II